MPLADHLRELRNRLTKAMLAIVVASVAAAFYSQELMEFLSSPVPRCAKDVIETGGKCATISYNNLLSPFTTTVKVVLMAGIIVSCPVWLYQLWAFVAPGLHKTEKKYTYYFAAAAVPLFAAGVYLAYLIMPVSMKVLLSITPDTAANFLEVDTILDFTTRMVLIFGFSFELPLLLVMLNAAGVVTGKRMAGWWRGVIMGIFVFGAIATPSTDPVGMFALAGPIIVLYFVAVGFALLNDKRRRRNDPDAELDDDEASVLDLTPEPVGGIEAVPAARAIPEQAGADSFGPGRKQLNGYDDVT
ncbi:twin arginine-targeting protein translocase TatC [Streptomyces agglomeratus]|uniref:Sec-independent protein translocase protein TatC n=1 Tax=Streptomyces agglomeratus TaxID=285458 RepID=A0A1E5PJM5_9ACTN|nr:twin-arginine translocase subunit TatC [Streptomyces agglomeratus]OEJ29751.1 twin arginine-targeting protein translocase TatC [Streptomyces agglomeratus]OEJ42230.1 twin arginine-targeting protein translocase TatC [Streptomyces agglomeratus]OEJ49261.1 twin arginine-targeting protein translocase TatC [Streptomyces agglomeratus]OEJ55544.1 twin arginine-targeting protein translocase TatC [Streptomyces agglomeratus]OEJ62924.1 twin arginine-targeting protein translocase TatC [Streptomyces agglome